MTTYEELQDALLKHGGIKAEIDIKNVHNLGPVAYPNEPIVKTITIKDLYARTTVVTILGDLKLIFHEESHLSIESLGKLLDLLKTPENERFYNGLPKRFRVHMLPGNDGYLYINIFTQKLFTGKAPKREIGIGSVRTYFNKIGYTHWQQENSDYLPKFDKDDPRFEFLEDIQ